MVKQKFDVTYNLLIFSEFIYIFNENYKLKLHSFMISAIQYEPWFGSRYIEEDISPSLLKLWGNPLEIAPSLHLPSRNDFIPSDFSLRNANMPKSLSNISCPQCIIDNPLMKLWYKMDTTFNVPRANVYFLITVKDGYSSVKNCVLTELFINLLKDELNEIIYQVYFKVKEWF